MEFALIVEKTEDFVFGLFYWLQTIGRKSEFLFTTHGITFSLRKNTSDLFVVQESFNFETYRIQPSGTVFDIGANIGAFTLYAAKTANRVYAFELESSNYKQLQKNVKQNSFSNIHTFKNAVGGSTKEITLYKALLNKGHSSTSLRVSNETERVEMISLQDALNLCGVTTIDLLKIDIEGGEYELIENIPDPTFQSIHSIAMEFHRVPGRSYRNLAARLEQLDYAVKIKRNIFEHILGTGILIATKP